MRWLQTLHNFFYLHALQEILCPLQTCPPHSVQSSLTGSDHKAFMSTSEEPAGSTTSQEDLPRKAVPFKKKHWKCICTVLHIKKCYIFFNSNEPHTEHNASTSIYMTIFKMMWVLAGSDMIPPAPFKWTPSNLDVCIHRWVTNGGDEGGGGVGWVGGVTSVSPHGLVPAGLSMKSLQATTRNFQSGVDIY